MNERLRSPAVIVGAAVAAVIVIALIVAFCSGGDDEAADTTISASTSTTAGGATTAAPTTSGAPTTTAAPTTTSAEAGATTTSPATTSTTAPPDTTTTTTPDTTAPPTTYPPSERPDGPFVRIGDDYFPFTPTECLIYDGIDAVVTGPGEAPDGTPVHVALQIGTLRIDIGTQDPMEAMDNHWAAGEDYGGELEVTLDNWLVHADAVVVHGPTARGANAELEAECTF